MLGHCPGLVNSQKKTHAVPSFPKQHAVPSFPKYAFSTWQGLRAAGGANRGVRTNPAQPVDEGGHEVKAMVLSLPLRPAQQQLVPLRVRPDPLQQGSQLHVGTRLCSVIVYSLAYPQYCQHCCTAGKRQ